MTSESFRPYVSATPPVGTTPQLDGLFMRIMDVLADATNQIAEGEVLQLLHVGNPDTSESDYLRVIERKTAVLFAAATRSIAAAPIRIDAPTAACSRIWPTTA